MIYGFMSEDNCPDLPPGFKHARDSTRVYGPSGDPELLTSDRCESSLELVGPLQPGEEIADHLRHLGSRTASSSTNASTVTPPTRESWMTELPSARTVSHKDNLVARGFRPTAAASQDLSWAAQPVGASGVEVAGPAEPPSDTFQSPTVAARDADMQKRVEEHNESHKRKKSLLDIHDKKRRKKDKKEKKKKKKKDKKRELSPSQIVPRRETFDREKHLSVTMIDPKARKNLMSTAAALNNKFQSGSQKFL